MELGNQIRYNRNRLNLSQEDLAQKIYVSRQTISNWENEKNYPDIHSLLLMSNLFDISLDQLIKGDLTMMREKVKEDDIKVFQFYGNIYTVLLFTSILVAVPLIYFLKIIGIVILAVLYAITLFYAFRVEKYKKKFDIQTYREIVAFCDGEKLDEIQKEQESGKRIYQKILLAIGAGMITIIVSAIILVIIKALFG